MIRVVGEFTHTSTTCGVRGHTRPIRVARVDILVDISLTSVYELERAIGAISSGREIPGRRIEPQLAIVLEFQVIGILADHIRQELLARSAVLSTGGTTKWDIAKLPPFFRISRVTPSSILSIRITTIVLLETRCIVFRRRYLMFMRGLRIPTLTIASTFSFSNSATVIRLILRSTSARRLERQGK